MFKLSAALWGLRHLSNMEETCISNQAFWMWAGFEEEGSCQDDVGVLGVKEEGVCQNLVGLAGSSVQVA